MLPYKILAAAEVLELAASIKMLASLCKQRSCKTVSLKATFVTFVSFAIPYICFLFTPSKTRPFFFTVLNHVVKPSLLLTLGYTMYKMVYELPWCKTYDAKKDGFNLGIMFFIPLVIATAGVYCKPLGTMMGIQWYASFLRAGALIPQSFVFCDYIKNNEAYDYDLFQWVVFRSVAIVARILAATSFHQATSAIDSWIMVKYCFEIIFFCDCLYWNLEFAAKSKGILARARALIVGPI